MLLIASLEESVHQLQEKSRLRHQQLEQERDKAIEEMRYTFKTERYLYTLYVHNVHVHKHQRDLYALSALYLIYTSLKFALNIISTFIATISNALVCSVPNIQHFSLFYWLNIL